MTYGVNPFRLGRTISPTINKMAAITKSKTRWIPKVAATSSPFTRYRMVSIRNWVASLMIRRGETLFRPMPTFCTSSSRWIGTLSSMNNTCQR